MKQRVVKRYLKPRRRVGTKGSARWFYFWQVPRQVLSFLNRLRKRREIRRHTFRSHNEYQSYDDWELQIYERGSVYTYNNGAMVQTGFRDIRDASVAPIIAKIEDLIATGKDPVRVLEIGCGNSVNLAILKDKFGSQIDLKGIEISKERIRIGREYFGSRLDNVEIVEDNAIDLTSVDDDSFDIVYSVHCLEQLPYNTSAAVREMERVSRNLVIFYEPVFEFSNTAQKLFLLFSDYQRTLLPEIEASKLEILECYPSELLANPLNKSGVVVAKKT